MKKRYPVHIEGSQVCSFSFFLLKAFWCKFLPSIYSFAETEKTSRSIVYIKEKWQSTVFWFVCRCVLVVSATSCMDHYANTFRLRYATPPEKANGVILGKNFAEHFLREGGRWKEGDEKWHHPTTIGSRARQCQRLARSIFGISNSHRSAMQLTCAYIAPELDQMWYTQYLSNQYIESSCIVHRRIFFQSRYQACENGTPR